MEWFSYQHLHYFWIVAKEGSIVAACRKLHVTQPTISAQIQALEAALGETLFERAGKRLILTEAGQLAVRYAEEIFALGQEFLDTLKGRPSGRRPLLRIGVVDALPKRLVLDILDPVYAAFADIRLVCREEKADVLFLELAAQKLDILLTDAPLGAGAKVKAFNHLLGESGMTFFAPPALAAGLRKGFPGSLHGVPMIVPMDHTVLRRSLDQWLDAHRIQPKVIGEFQDSALLDAFGMAGRGVFLGPTRGESEVKKRFGVSIVGRTAEVKGQYYVISPERRVRHPAVAHLLDRARRQWASSRAP